MALDVNVPYEDRALILLHEFGHNAGLDDIVGTSDNFMNIDFGQTNTQMSNPQCLALQADIYY